MRALGRFARHLAFCYLAGTLAARLLHPFRGDPHIWPAYLAGWNDAADAAKKANPEQ